MKRLALVAALLGGCASLKDHEVSIGALANAGVIVGAGVCAEECHGGAREAADGVLIAEAGLAVVTVFVAAVVLVAFMNAGKQ